MGVTEAGAMCRPLDRSIYLPVCASVCQSIDLTVYVSICQSILVASALVCFWWV